MNDVTVTSFIRCRVKSQRIKTDHSILLTLIYELIYELKAFSRTSPTTYPLLRSVLPSSSNHTFGGGTKAEICPI